MWLLDTALNIYMDTHVIVHLAVVVFGLSHRESKSLPLHYGVLAETEMVHVHVTDVIIIKVLLEEHIIQRQFPLLEVVSIKFVLVEFTDVVLENVMVA